MRRSIALLCLPLLLAAGCARAGSDPARVGPAVTPLPSGVDYVDHRWEAFYQRAGELADAWRPGEAWRSGYVPLQDATIPTGDKDLDDDIYQAFRNGWYRAQIPLPTAAPAEGTIRFPDGTLRVPLVSADEAYAQIAKGDPPPCPGRPKVPPATPGAGRPKAGGPTIEPGPDTPVSTQAKTPCVALTVTGVELGSVSVQTSRGAAEVPAWLFTVAERRAPVARLAVAPAAIGAVPEVMAPARRLPGELSGVQSLDKIDGARLYYTIIGGACDTSVTPLVLERDDVVVLGAGRTTSGQTCPAIAVSKPLSVTLKAPLGDRTVVDVRLGTPVTLQR